MVRFFVALALLLGLALAVAFVPVRGRTVLDRWNASRGARDFLERSFHEAKVAAGLEPEKPRPGRARAGQPPKPQARGARPGAPTENLSDADRAAVDRIIAERGAR